MRSRSVELERYAGFSLWETGLDRAEELTPFVYEAYLECYADRYGWDGAEFEKMRTDDRLTCDRSRVFTARAFSGTILATSRLIERTAAEPLPVETDFGIRAFSACRRAGIRRPRRIFEAARLAKSARALGVAGLSRQDAGAVVDAVVHGTVRAASRQRGNVLFASLDNHVLELLRGRGFGFVAAGPSRRYLGSPTTPVLLDLAACRDAMFHTFPARWRACFGPAPLVEAA